MTALARNRGGEFVFIVRGDQTEMMLCSKIGINPPRFGLLPVDVRAPLKGVLLDLDGTCVKSEPLWIEVIFRTTNEMRTKLGLPALEGFADEDTPHVSGRTVPDHLEYCRDKYFPAAAPEDARSIYDRITGSDDEMAGIIAAIRERGASPYEPAPGLLDLLLFLKDHGVKISMVTSGLHYKAWPETEPVFEKLGLGNPVDFLDAYITAGTRPGRGRAGTMGDAVAKPWPNIYFEAARAMGFEQNDAAHYLIVGDSASDVGSARTMGVAIIGVAGGNIECAGVSQLCWTLAEDLHAVKDRLAKYVSPR